MNTSRFRARWWYWLVTVITAGACIGAGGWLYAQRDALFWKGRDTDPISGPVIQVQSATGRMEVRFADRNAQWDWDWTTPHCLQALITWSAPDQVRSLQLQLTDPGTHPLGLPIRSLYPEEHVSPGIAGAWCETRGLEDQPDLMCSIAPLAGVHPAHVTVAVMGALAQAGAYALEGTASLPRNPQAWSWSRWHPLVERGIDGAAWQSACPSLTPQTRRFP